MGDSKDCCHRKATPRQAADVKKLKNRLSRMQGQLSGIGKMLDENRYCGDILTQIAAVESALQAFGHLILEEHMETCVREKILQEDPDVIGETLELIRKLR
ncbi:MAG: metal-sensing transcriptional repressor [Clostridium sp.]|nr:metal-sensing transcriptional repressor [Acetatifactor muris]MCM1526832.1 metal-sensing transcriptional repressor [Bacteroides sp.]MCM1562968.1 metal-sensing transcriptional repressor [Clostridium sp.]